MYSDKHIVNLLTSLLVEKGVRKAVVCPGSRNVPLVHNFVECPQIECFPVTDERSAAFYALGLSLASGEAVVVCVTSGSAVLNAAPAVAEAYYRHVPLIVVSADRPAEWIDRLDGQTLRQYGVLGNFVKRQIDLSEIRKEDRTAVDHAALSLNAVLNGCVGGEQGPVHINVHIDEPLFRFTESILPQGVGMGSIAAGQSATGLPEEMWQVVYGFVSAAVRLIVIGQISRHDAELDGIIRQLGTYYIVLNEPLASSCSVAFDKAVPCIGECLKDTGVDFLLSFGGTLVSKSLKKMLRSADIRQHWEVNEDGEAHDMFQQQTGVACCPAKTFLRALLEETCRRKPVDDALSSKVRPCLESVGRVVDAFVPPYSQMMAVRELERRLCEEYGGTGGSGCGEASSGSCKASPGCEVHYANSMAVRLGCQYSTSRYVWCNRGVNGIEGSLSAAAGFSLATASAVFCVIGDLSFFYDQNALWNAQLRGNFRVMLLNNGGGFIFNRLPGLDASHASMPYISGTHAVTAEGISRQNGALYLSAHNEEEFCAQLPRFVAEPWQQPVVFEVFTCVEEDARAHQLFDDTVACVLGKGK